ncbi:MAG: DinB family protein [Chitinophagaceae bacterium]|nr:MAG: DinB family protein [Chitinophagaceae bacterium]
MIVKSLIGEFEHEVENTRKLLLAVPQKDLQFKPSPISWSMGELSQHIATIYYWYVGTLTKDVYNIDADDLERGDPNDIEATLALFERNVIAAREALNQTTEESMQQPLTMMTGGQAVLGPMPRGIVARGFLFNHLYHHRGELIVHLRATGNKVPGLYGPNYEETTQGSWG